MLYYKTLKAGGMAEWLKAAVLKTVIPRGIAGSNPVPSARKFPPGKFHHWHVAPGLWQMHVRKQEISSREISSPTNCLTIEACHEP